MGFFSTIGRRTSKTPGWDTNTANARQKAAMKRLNAAVRAVTEASKPKRMIKYKKTTTKKKTTAKKKKRK